MARLKITIEGEMSPEEMKRYIAAAWGNLPRDIAVSEVDLDEPSGTLEVPVLAIEETVAVPVVVDPIQELPATPAPIPVSPPPEPEPAGSFADTLSSFKKLSQVLQAIVDSGQASDLAGVVTVCQQMQGQVPILERLGAGLEDRVTRTWAGMQ